MWNICNKVATKYTTRHHNLTASLHYLVKYKFSEVTIITTNTYAKTHLLKRFSTKHRWVASASSGSCTEHWSAHWTSIL